VELSSIVSCTFLMVAALFFSIPAAIFTEGLTEVLSKSLVFSGLRSRLGDKRFVGKVLSCGYCTSVWVAILPTALYSYASYRAYSSIVVSAVTFVFFVFFIQRLSNYTHNVNDKFLDKFYSKGKEVK